MPDPDFKGFTNAMMKEWNEHFDMEATERFELAIRFNIIKPIPGGFDPEIHACPHCCSEPGDPWYSLNYSPEE